MRSYLLAATAAVVVAAIVPAQPPTTADDLARRRADAIRNGPNLVPNGDFEKGTITPDHWQSIDNLTSFWELDPAGKRGKVIRFDTDVLQTQAYEWWTKIAKGIDPRHAPKKLPTTPPKYDTIAGLDGVWYWSDYIPIEKGKSYWLSIDAKGPAMLAWLVGYPEKGSTAFGSEAGAFLEAAKKIETGKEPKQGRDREPFIHSYVWKGRMDLGGSNEWRTYSRKEKPFRPTAVTPKVKFVRVMIYPFWPPSGDYFIDNVRLVEYPEPPEEE